MGNYSVSDRPSIVGSSLFPIPCEDKGISTLVGGGLSLLTMSKIFIVTLIINHSDLCSSGILHSVDSLLATNQCCITCQKSKDLIYTLWIHETTHNVPLSDYFTKFNSTEMLTFLTQPVYCEFEILALVILKFVIF